MALFWRKVIDVGRRNSYSQQAMTYSQISRVNISAQLFTSIHCPSSTTSSIPCSLKAIILRFQIRRSLLRNGTMPSPWIDPILGNQTQRTILYWHQPQPRRTLTLTEDATELVLRNATLVCNTARYNMITNCLQGGSPD